MSHDTQHTAFPLSWPVGHKRTAFRSTSRFGTAGRMRGNQITLNQTMSLLQGELDRLGARKCVVSSNLELRLDGLPRGGQSRPADPGVAVYFELRGKPIVLPCDRWDRVECNLMAIVKHIEATRGLERWGVGTIERAFEGYAALPAPGQSQAVTCWQLLGIAETKDLDAITAAYRDKAKRHHPDVSGGSAEMMARLNDAKQQATAFASTR